MGDELAQKWLNAVVPSWLYRWLMPAGWLAAMVAVVVSVNAAGSDALCSASDPSICGPDPTFSLAVVACVACLVAWWRMPRFAAVAGLVYLAMELRYDEDASGRLAWIIYGAACLVVLIALTWSNWRRKKLLAGVPRAPVAIPPAAPLGTTPAWLGVGVLVIIGGVALGVMQAQVHREAGHVGRAVQQTAVVDLVEDDGDLVLNLPDGRRHTLFPTDYYTKGAQIPVLVDPSDSSWLRLQAEPADYTYWYLAVGGAWLLASVLLWRDVVRRRARPRRGWTAGGLPVRIAPDAVMDFAIMPRGDSDRVLGFVALEADDAEEDVRLLEAYAMDEDEESEIPWTQLLRRYEGDALLVGDLVDGAWPTVVLGDRILRPVSAFRSPRRTPWSVEEPITLSLDDEPYEDPEPVLPELAAVLPELPWRVPLAPIAWWMKPALIASLAGTPVAVGVLVAVWSEWWLAIAGAVAIAVEVVVLVTALFQQVVVTPTGLRLRGALFERTVDWRDVEAVEVEQLDDEPTVTLTTDDSWHVISRIPEDQVHQVAGVFEAVRRQAGVPERERPARRRLSPGLAVIACYLASCGAVFGVLGLT